MLSVTPDKSAYNEGDPIAVDVSVDLPPNETGTYEIIAEYQEDGVIKRQSALITADFGGVVATEPTVSVSPQRRGDGSLPPSFSLTPDAAVPGRWVGTIPTN